MWGLGCPFEGLETHMAVCPVFVFKAHPEIALRPFKGRFSRKSADWETLMEDVNLRFFPNRERYHKYYRLVA